MKNSSIKPNRASVLGYPVDLVNKQEALSFIEDYLKESKSGHVVTINPEMIAQAQQHQELHNALINADLVIPDGVGIAIALKKVGLNIKQLPGIEFSESLIELCSQKDFGIGFLGASKNTVEEAAKQMKFKYPNLKINYIQDGYFSEDDKIKIIEEIKTKNIKVLFVALGVPKQELWISKYKKELSSIILVGVGGSFDVWSNNIERAPLTFRKLGLEWLYRLLTQPSRFNRMFPTLPLFFIKVLLDKNNTKAEYVNLVNN